MNTFYKIALGVLAAGAACLPAHAALIGVTGPTSSAGTAAAIISAPSQVTDTIVFNTGQEGFNERQGVTLAGALSVDGGTIAAGTAVNSHMIFLNKQYQLSGSLFHGNVSWTFDGAILGVMSDSSGNLEAASTSILGALGTTYEAPFPSRGLNGGGDVYRVLGNTLTLSMSVTHPGDWIRVVTASRAVSEPANLGLFGLGLVGLGIAARRRKTH